MTTPRRTILPRAALTTCCALLLSVLPATATATAAPADTDPRFTVAVVPDTQEEVLRQGDGRFAQRTRWLVGERARLDLRYVLHTGDAVNWGWLDERQYAVAGQAMDPLAAAGIPYTVAPGNHDTRAVGWNGRGGYGGDAYVKNPECRQRFAASECDTAKLVRHTEEFNQAFAARERGVDGAYEPGRVDNVYDTFEAGGLRWLVLTLELWPRTGAVEWARSVVAAHPRHNVVVATHSYLDDASAISSSAEYGSTSPRYLFDRLISRYPNISMVFSGHTGIAGARTDTGVAGNRIASFLGTFHSATTNPVRLLTVDPGAGSVTTRFVAPATGESYPQYDRTVTGLTFVR